ncbi:MAG: polyribonucleotide nucleotidyltransferase [Mariniblastus sp.]|nr:polyribonucleotide nucleotidyltransferase [Mariniblastus sp.]
MKVKVEKKIGDGVLSFETGYLAKQAAACVLVQYNDTVVLSTAATGSPRPGIDFFPLMCDYRERTCAAGKFPGGFIKREGRPTTKETLTARLVDRPIRPMFAEGFKDEVQCQNFVLSSDKQTDGDVLAMNGAATACFISPMPFLDPVASTRVSRIDGEFVAFPTHDQLEESDMDLIISATDDAITMIEGFAREVPEDEMLEALEFGHVVCRQVISLMRELYEKANVEKTPFSSPEDDGILDQLISKYYDDYKSAILIGGKHDRGAAKNELKDKIKAEMIPDADADDALDMGALKTAIHDLEERVIRDSILAGTRSDGRDGKTLRAIECQTNVIPRVHGSAIFQRGETQALITVTLGTGRDEQRVDGLLDEYSKKFMLDYNFPSFSVGECRPIRGPGRREIGHGALAERSIKPVLPDQDDFPYTIRIVSDILESNGSSSMATVCGTTLGLMAAGVRIKNPVAGISVGMVKEGDDYALLTDILGSEDHFGDMDFKVAGTQNGITGIQLDLKIRGISCELLKEALAQSREARIEILRTMLQAIPRPLEDLSEHAPRLLVTQIDPEKIGMLIGPGGKNIRSIQETTQTVIEVSEDGRVTVAGTNGALAEAALKKVEACTATVQVGKIYDGTVSSVKDFGAFVEILPGRDGLCHISELSGGFIDNVEDICHVGDEMKVLVLDVDGNDRVKLSRRKALEELGLEDELATADNAGGGSSDDGEDRPPREDRGDRGDRGGDRGRSGGGGRGRSGGGGGGGRSRSGGGGGRGRSGGGGGGGRGRR